MRASRLSQPGGRLPPPRLRDLSAAHAVPDGSQCVLARRRRVQIPFVRGFQGGQPHRQSLGDAGEMKDRLGLAMLVLPLLALGCTDSFGKLNGTSRLQVTTAPQAGATLGAKGAPL